MALKIVIDIIFFVLYREIEMQKNGNKLRTNHQNNITQQSGKKMFFKEEN